ncbi:hypothetical protein D9Q98_003239 [Chlorella vulgaris]|uniref:CAF17 C-terminal domain-containing protein n=1 Tax=Chlorella vulgaris TaxID=3077 RepID=A0A9D4TS54_CHLVU|nr:hypothetical protein D9Q98_003239 [Chlorella vulgaris]
MLAHLASPIRVACLDEVRSVIRLSGAGLVHFLQGLVTNDVLGLETPGAQPLYTCILNAQGRHLHDLFLHRTLDEVPTVLVDADRQGAADLLRLLKRYRLRQRLDIDDASEQYSVWARYGGHTPTLHDTHSTTPPPAVPGWAPDPRLQDLGLRALLPAGVDGGGKGVAAASWRDHRQWRILQGVAEGDTEIPSGEVVPLEFNIDGLHGISFTKGCYVGQELMARTHFKGVVRKRLMPFVLAPDKGGSTLDALQPEQLPQLGGSAVPAAALAATAAAAGDADVGGAAAGGAGGVQQGATVYLAPQGGKRKSVGTVRVIDGRLGLAVLRLSAVQAASAADQLLVVGEGEATAYLRPWRPNWWPNGWGREEAAGAAA